jgi:hypothetical protein
VPTPVCVSLFIQRCLGNYDKENPVCVDDGHSHRRLMTAHVVQVAVSLGVDALVWSPGVNHWCPA